jgi:[ribosomal protein S5]-alanine N-acetyltransferase
MKPIVLQSEGFYLRPIQKEDIHRGWYEWINNTELSAEISSLFPKSYDDLMEYIESSQPPKAILFAVCDNNDVYFGNARISEIDWINRSCTYGRFIGDPKYRSKGYGTKLLFLLLDYCFSHLGMNRVYTKVFANNIASNKSNRKVGMFFEGTLRQSIMHMGELTDINIYSMLKSEYIDITSHGK